MNPEILSQTISQLKQANNILIVIDGESDQDVICAALATQAFLLKQNKQTTVVSTTTLPQKLKFLAEADRLKSALSLTKNLVIDINTQNRELAEMRYQKFDDKLSIFLATKQGELLESDVQIKPSVY